jgi:SAM-dependent methyltransferase
MHAASAAKIPARPLGALPLTAAELLTYVVKTRCEGHNTGTLRQCGTSKMAHAGQDHWDEVYEKKTADEVSWYEPHPEKSLQLIRATGIPAADPIIDVGGGASRLVDELLAAGYGDLTVLDISASVLEKLRARLGSAASAVTLLHQDVTAFQPARRYALWHDRAVFHFLTRREDRGGYVRALRQGIRPGGQVLMATFGPAGPERCSGLPTVRYDATTLAAELGADFTPVESFLVVHRTPWNSDQQFLYCRFRALPISPQPPCPSRRTS